jgi:hypothetical protein
MSTITTASTQWASRPDDQRYTSLTDMKAHFDVIRSESREVVVPSRRIHVLPDQDNKGMSVVGPNGHAYTPTNWSFGQLAQLAEAPAGYMRTLPSPIAADCLNYGLQFKRDIEDVGVLLQRNGDAILRAATGPRYGRIWNSEIVGNLVDRFGDGVTGEWKVPGEFRQAVTVTKANTTLYASDRDMFVFLADESHQIELPRRRDGKPGSMARGFFVWNSEVGAATFGLATFLYDFVCCNRMIWGAEQFAEIRIRHTVSAPDKFLDEIRPALVTYANSSTDTITSAIERARDARLGDKLDTFLAERFGKRAVEPLKAIHMLEENRPMESLWDVATAVTARARSITYQDERVAMERQAGAILDLVAA